MSAQRCSMDGCDRKARARGWCGKHWERWRQTGDPMGIRPFGRPTRAAHLRILDRAPADESGCWTYQGSAMHTGYAQTAIGSKTSGTRQMVLVHRAVYEALVGAIPKGLVIDHLCHNRVCVNPAHLEAVTPAENSRRAVEYRESRRAVA